jgi:carboxymethylenebutenolidase
MSQNDVTTLTVPVTGGDLPADLHLPPSGQGPGIVLLQEIFGVTEYISGRARDLASQGYVVLVPHIYWRLGDQVVSEAQDGLPEAMGLLQRLDWDAAVGDAAAAVSALRDRDEVRGPVGVLGFCFGGGLAFAVAAATSDDDAAEGARPDALVSYYGSALPDLLGQASKVRLPSLHHFGLADDYIPQDKVREIEDAVTAGGRDATFLTYAGAGHAFDNPSPMFHDAAASKQAWVATEQWLAEHLPV